MWIVRRNVEGWAPSFVSDHTSEEAAKRRARSLQHIADTHPVRVLAPAGTPPRKVTYDTFNTHEEIR